MVAIERTRRCVGIYGAVHEICEIASLDVFKAGQRMMSAACRFRESEHASSMACTC